MGTMGWPELQHRDVEVFKSLDAETRALIIRMLDDPVDADHKALNDHPQSKMLATWLLELPAYKNVPDWLEDDEEDPAS